MDKRKWSNKSIRELDIEGELLEDVLIKYFKPDEEKLKGITDKDEWEELFITGKLSEILGRWEGIGYPKDPGKFMKLFNQNRVLKTDIGDIVITGYHLTSQSTFPNFVIFTGSGELKD